MELLVEFSATCVTSQKINLGLWGVKSESCGLLLSVDWTLKTTTTLISAHLLLLRNSTFQFLLLSTRLWRLWNRKSENVKTRKIWERLNFGDLTFETFSAVVVHRVEEKVPGRLKIGILLLTLISRKIVIASKGLLWPLEDFLRLLQPVWKNNFFGGKRKWKFCSVGSSSLSKNFEKLVLGNIFFFTEFFLVFNKL